MTSHDCARALLAMPPFPMSRVPSPPRAGKTLNPKAKYKGRPDSEFALRLHALFGRKPDTLWTNEEVALFLEIKGSYDAADMTALEGYYKAEKAKGDGDKGGRHRRDLSTFLRNYGGECDRARAHWEASQKRIKRYEPKPSNVVPMEPVAPLIPEDQARALFRDAVKLTS